jgi:transposase
MSKDLQELKKELESLKKQRVIKAKELERALARTTGRLTDPSNRGFAAGIAEELKKLEKRIAEKEAEIEKAEGDGQKS